MDELTESRPQEHLDELITYLKGLGATEVITDEYLASHEMKELIKVCNHYQLQIILIFHSTEIHASTTWSKLCWRKEHY